MLRPRSGPPHSTSSEEESGTWERRLPSLGFSTSSRRWLEPVNRPLTKFRMPGYLAVAEGGGAVTVTVAPLCFGISSGSVRQTPSREIP